MLFLGMANAYVMRTNMSVAIVAMVNHTYIDENSHGEVVDDECPNANYTEVVSFKCQTKLFQFYQIGGSNMSIFTRAI